MCTTNAGTPSGEVEKCNSAARAQPRTELCRSTINCATAFVTRVYKPNHVGARATRGRQWRSPTSVPKEPRAKEVNEIHIAPPEVILCVPRLVTREAAQGGGRICTHRPRPVSNPPTVREASTVAAARLPLCALDVSTHGALRLLDFFVGRRLAETDCRKRP